MHKDGALIVHSNPLFMHCQKGSAELPAVLVLHFSEQQCLAALNDCESLAHEMLGSWGYYVYAHSSLFTLDRGPLPSTLRLGVSFNVTGRQPELTSEQLKSAREQLKVAFAFRGTATATPIRSGSKIIDHQITVQRIVDEDEPITYASSFQDAAGYPQGNLGYTFVTGRQPGGTPAVTRKSVYDAASTILASGMNAFLLGEITFAKR